MQEAWAESQNQKANVMRLNKKCNDAVAIDGNQFEEVEEFTNLGTKMTAYGNSEAESDHAYLKLVNLLQPCETFERPAKLAL